MPNWTHSELGRFKYDFTGWARDVEFPAFTPFRYHWGGRRKTRDTIRLEFHADDEAEKTIPVPSRGAISVAQRTIQNQLILADRIVKAMWKDLNGLGRNSGMWWHGDLPTANEMIANVFGARPVKKLAVPEDLYEFMGTILVHIRESTYKYQRPSATICFAAAFDDEHGVGVLTDGTRVLGIGHQSDVTPFKS